MVSHSPFVVFAHLSGITKDCQIEWRLSRSSSLVYYTIMKGKSELYQNGSMYCTWFVTASTWDIVLNLVSYGTGTLPLFLFWLDYIRFIELRRPFGCVHLLLVLLCLSVIVNSRNHTMRCTRRTSTSSKIQEYGGEAFLLRL